MTSIHPCLDVKEYGKCPGCRIALHCKKWRGSIVTLWNEQINKRYKYLDFEKRKELITELFRCILKFYYSINNFEPLVRYSFYEAQKEFIKNYGLTGNFISVKTPPDNIDNLIDSEEVKKYLVWDGSSKRLVLVSDDLPVKIYENLLHEAKFKSEEKAKNWRTILNKIKRKVREKECGNLFERKNVTVDVNEIHHTEKHISASAPEGGWQSELENKNTELSAISPSEEQISDSTTDDTEIGDPPSGVKINFSTAIEILSLSSSKESKICQELFNVHVSKNLNSERTAEEMGWSYNNTRKKISRCYALTRKIALQILGSIRSSAAQRCYQLLRNIEAIRKETGGARKGAIAAYAKQNNLDVKTVNSQLHKCRVEVTEALALYKLEQANG